MTRFALAALVVFTLSCRQSEAPLDPELSSAGSAEVTAQLLEIPGTFPSNDLYNYAYVMKYRVLAVHRGSIAANTEIFVGHYNPLKPRSRAQDQESGRIGGRVESFRAGDVHRMALEAPLDQQWMGGIVDKYYEQKGVRYWALWTNPGKK